MNEKFNLGFQALSFARGSPLSPSSLSCGAPDSGGEAPRAAGRLRGAAARGWCCGVIAPRTRNTRDPGEGCWRTAYSAHVRRPIRPGGLQGGGAGVTRSRPPWGFPARGSARPVAASHVQDAAFGVGRPVGGRTADLREEGDAVGGPRVPRPQGGRLAGGLLLPLGAGRRRERWAAAFPASRAGAGRPSEGLRA